MRPGFPWRPITMALTLVAAALLVAGCSRGTRVKRPPTYPVGGVVTFDGRPLAEATVSFNRVGGGDGAVALTDTEGRYRLTTFVPNDGCLPGEYEVTISKITFSPPASDSPMATSGDPRNLLPPRYANSQTSGFAATVEAGPGHTFDFALEK
jgi:hypothetical protein